MELSEPVYLHLDHYKQQQHSRSASNTETRSTNPIMNSLLLKVPHLVRSTTSLSLPIMLVPSTLELVAVYPAQCSAKCCLLYLILALQSLHWKRKLLELLWLRPLRYMFLVCLVLRRYSQLSMLHTYVAYIETFRKPGDEAMLWKWISLYQGWSIRFSRRGGYLLLMGRSRGGVSGVATTLNGQKLMYLAMQMLHMDKLYGSISCRTENYRIIKVLP